jgi:hypothetical protein
LRKITGILLLFISCLGSSPLLAQNYNSQKRINIYAARFSDARSSMNRFILKNAIRVQRKEELLERFTADFILPEKYLPSLDSLALTLGYVTENTLTSQDPQLRTKQYRTSIQDETENQQRLREQLQSPGLEPQQKQNLQSRLDQSEANLKRLRQELSNYEDYYYQAQVVVNIYDEVTYPTGNSKISFVNMPGVEYSMLFVENPKAGLSAERYQGYLIKYLFTRGKSYLDLGVYKAVNNNRSDSTLVNELFLINFGQDFYPRHFGRGSRKYLNLYTCYQVGGFIANRNDERKERFIPNLNLGIGVEIYKTKHLLLDNKISYFIPLDQVNRNFRSLAYNLSLNFVF